MDANTCIPYLEVYGGHPFPRLTCRPDLQLYFPLVGKFNRITEQVKEDLFKPHYICPHKTGKVR
jgi:hypothetical protein